MSCHCRHGPQSIKQVPLWNPTDIGYRAIHMAKAQIDGTLPMRTGGTLDAGRLGKLDFVADDIVLLGNPLIFDVSNIDQYDF
jgi:rhamnose transport system substrate-binding protein